jgi:hypothetical protein
MDMSTTVAPKSNQLNADDLIAGPRTITVTKVSGSGNGEQPVAVSFEGDGGKPFYPCKSMRRVMIAAWGVDAADYVGRSMTLYRDPSVQYGGMAVGGIRISHMSDIPREMVMALTVTKAKRAPYTVKPLARPPQEPARQPEQGRSKADQRADQIVAMFEACDDYAAVEEAARKAKASMDALGQLPDQKPFQRADAARSAAYQRHMKPPADIDLPEDDFPGMRPMEDA